jgi:uncharacterized RDD family membrane protein YckC
MSEISPGWFKDPADPSTQRYWDGEGWLGKAIPADATPPDGPPPHEEPAVPDPPVPTTGGPAPGGLAPGHTGQGQTGYGTPNAPQSWTPPPGWVPPPGWAPPPGWVPPPGWTPPAPGGSGTPPGWPGAPHGSGVLHGSGVPHSFGPPPGWTPTPGAPAYGAPPQGWLPGQPGTPMAYAFPTEARPHGLALAGLGQRLVARILDIIAVLLLNVVVNGWFAYQWVLEFSPMWRAAMENPTGARPEASERLQYLMLTILFIATALWLAYEVPAIGGTGQTLGKRIMHIKVVRVENLDPIGYGRAFRRWARLGMWTTLWWCYGIGLLFQLIDSASVLFDRTMRQALHDKTAHTVVVEAPPVAKVPPVPNVPDGERGGSTADNGVPDDGPDPTGGAR